MRKSIFDCGFEKSGEFHVENDLWKNGFCVLGVNAALQVFIFAKMADAIYVGIQSLYGKNKFFEVQRTTP